MDLESVEQKWLANMQPYLDALDAAIAKNAEVVASCAGVETAMAEMAKSADAAATVTVAAMGAVADAAGNVVGYFDLAATAADLMGADFDGANPSITSMTARLGNLNARTTDTVAHLMVLDAELDRKKAAFASVSTEIAALAAALAVVNGRINTSTASTAAANNGVRVWGTGLRVTNLALHGIVSGLVEFLAVAIPAAVAAGAWAAVWAQGAQNVQQHMSALYTATEATHAMTNQTVGSVLGLGSALQAAQDKANVNVYQALGSALLILKSNFEGLASVGLRVGQIFDQFAAKVVYDMRTGAGAEVHALLAGMVTDLVQLGQILGNVGHALLNFAAAMPGLANQMLTFADAISRVILWVSELPRWFIMAVFALHEFNTWGSILIATLRVLGVQALVMRTLGTEAIAVQGTFFGLARATAVLRNLFMLFPAMITLAGNALIRFGLVFPVFGGEVVAAGDALANFGADAAIFLGGLSAAGIIGITLGVAALAFGIGFLIDKMMTAQTAAQQFAGSLQQAVDKASNLKVLGVIAQSMAALNAQIAHQTDLLHSNYAALHDANGVNRRLINQIHQAPAAIATYTAKMRDLGQQFITVSQHADTLGKMVGGGLLQGLMVATAAGVKLSASMSPKQWAIAELQVQSYIRGLGAMGQASGVVGADLNALAIQSGLARTQVSQLNQAWDQFTGNLTAGTSGLAAFNQALSGLTSGTNQVTNILGKASGTVTLTMQDFAKSLQSFSGTGAQAWQNFNQVVSGSAQQLIDWLRTAAAEGTLTSGQFNNAVLAMVQRLKGFAGTVPAARAELLGLAQQAGINVSTWGALNKAIKDNHVSFRDLVKAVLTATTSMSDMGTVAQNLGNVVNSTVTSSMAAAALKAYGFQQAVSALAQAIKTYSANSPEAISAAYKLENIISQANGTLAAMPGLVAKAQGALNSLHGHPITIPLYIQQLGNLPQSPGGAGPGTPGHHVGAVTGAAAGGAAFRPAFLAPAVHVAVSAPGAAAATGMTVHHHHYNVTVNNAGSVIAQQDLVRDIVRHVGRATNRNMNNQVAYAGRGH